MLKTENSRLICEKLKKGNQKKSESERGEAEGKERYGAGVDLDMHQILYTMYLNFDSII